MLLKEATRRKITFLVLFFALTAILLWLWIKEKELCLGIPVISPENADNYITVENLNLDVLMYNGEKAPLDRQSNTLYLSQYERSLDGSNKLEGLLTCEDSNYALYFLNDASMKNLRQTVENGDTLTLLIVDENVCQKVNVVITTLPVMNIEGEETEALSRLGYVSAGQCTLFSGFDPSVGGASVKTTLMEWHPRGETTAKYDKKSYKLSLKQKNGDNNDCDFLGMGADDDWILNPMIMDDTKIREKTIMDLWNSFCDTTEWNYKMSCGEYVEVVLNGEYRGLYLLQRRVDGKYLEIDRDLDVLLKGKSSGTLLGGYEIVSSPFNEEDTYQLMVDTWEAVEGNQFHRQNFVDVSLLINYIAGWDNIGFKNMYYYLKFNHDRGGYDLYFIPWDTDMSFGFYWDNGFAYNYEEQLASNLYRVEYYTVQMYSEETDQALADRWNELRETLYTEDNITTLLKYNRSQILTSGALSRDEEKWGKIHNNTDTYENLYQFCLERLGALDVQYN